MSAWIERIMARPSWQKDQPIPEEIEALLPQAKALMKAHLT
jgi:hypothetical protein